MCRRKFVNVVPYSVLETCQARCSHTFWVLSGSSKLHPRKQRWWKTWRKRCFPSLQVLSRKSLMMSSRCLEGVHLVKWWYVCDPKKKKKSAQFEPYILDYVFFTIKRATWHVPVDQIALSEQGAAADREVDQTNEKSARPKLLPSASSKRVSRKPSSLERVPSGITKDVALKVIPKKKVKESTDEANVWGEMEVLKGLDHPNIVKDSLVLRII